MQGKPLFWDVREGQLSCVSEYAGSLRGPVEQITPSDTQVTLFLVDIRFVQVGTYGGNSSRPAFRAHAEIDVLYWPEKRFAGHNTFAVDPPSTITIPGGDIGLKCDSDIYYRIADWARDLPKLP
jgi:hypothetical protein